MVVYPDGPGEYLAAEVAMVRKREAVGVVLEFNMEVNMEVTWKPTDDARLSTQMSFATVCFCALQ